MSSGWSFQEIFLVFLIGLIVLGPERLPRVANQLGTLLGKARRMTRIMKQQLEDELDVSKEIRDVTQDIKNIYPPADQAPRDDDNYSPEHATTPEVSSTARAAAQADVIDADTEKPREHG